MLKTLSLYGSEKNLYLPTYVGGLHLRGVRVSVCVWTVSETRNTETKTHKKLPPPSVVSFRLFKQLSVSSYQPGFRA